MKMPKIKINSDMESTIVGSLMSQVDDRPNEIKHCEPNEYEEITGEQNEDRHVDEHVDRFT